MRLVKRRADQVVHGRIGDHEGLFAVSLHLENSRNESSGLRHQEAAGLQQQPAVEAVQRAVYRRGVFLHFGNGIKTAAMVVDSQSPSGIY